jgi:hypothetical protein
MRNLDGDEILPEVDDKPKTHKISPFDYVKAIEHTKKNMMEVEDGERQYNKFIVNRALSHSLDTLFYANEMNRYPSLDNHMQFTFLINSVRKRQRFTQWVKPQLVEHLDVVKQYYKYNTEKALQALSILTDDQILAIKKRLSTGGLKNGDERT